MLHCSKAEAAPGSEQPVLSSWVSPHQILPKDWLLEDENSISSTAPRHWSYDVFLPLPSIDQTKARTSAHHYQKGVAFPDGVSLLVSEGCR